MKLSDFDYVLPEQLIARFPIEKRSASRLLCLNRTTGEITHRQFSDLPTLLAPHDLLVCNDTRVIPARLWGKKVSGGKVELLIERVLENDICLAHVRGSRALQSGSRIILENNVQFEVIAKEHDLCRLRCMLQEASSRYTSIYDVLEELGEIPLPHYMSRAPDKSDLERYQTVFAKEKGSVAAPTAGLHFDQEVLQALAAKGIMRAEVTLHVGAGTFSPVRTEDIFAHRMHAERVVVSEETCAAVARAHAAGGRVIAVGTTSTRSLESASRSGTLEPYAGETDIFIYPGFQFHCIDGLITNFHLPRSTLLMLVAAFAGYENIMRAYAEAVREAYRFFSYGDAMLII